MSVAAELDFFRRWALGSMVDNTARGLYAEWMVGCALGCVDLAQPRREWDLADLRYRGLWVEVKASGRGQAHGPTKSVKFSVAPVKEPEIASTNTFLKLDPPQRVADVYVFCLHEPLEPTNENVADRASWSFWPVGTDLLDAELGGQKSIALSSVIKRFGEGVRLDQLRATMDSVLPSRPRFTASGEPTPRT